MIAEAAPAASTRKLDPRISKAEANRSLDELLSRLPPSDKQTDVVKGLVDAVRPMLKYGCFNLAPLLPAFLSLKGRPYTLDHHFPFEPFFSTALPRNITLKTGRQVSKSTSLAAQGVIISNCLPFFNTLFVTPLFELIRRFSNNYVRGFIDQSPVKQLWTSTATSSNVLQRSFTNNSNMFFSFASIDADRTRGLNCDKIAIDEVQDMDEAHIPIIQETMSGSPYGGMNQFTGTPKTLDNTIEGLWLMSSMAEWVMKCVKCGYRNVPALTHDLDKMIGPWHEDISEENPGIICAKCRQPKSVFPRKGRWIHGRPSDQIEDEHVNMMAEFPGYHVPQMILPMHYADPDKWSVLLTKRRTMPDHVFYNEVCGESFDAGSKLVTLSDLRRAATLHRNELGIALEEAKKYDTMKILAIDWGGGGQNPQKGGQLFISYTVYAVMTLVPDGSVHFLYGFRSKTPHDQYREARIALDLAGQFGCRYIAHDYSGAGQLREKIMVDAGFPLEKIAPVWYVPTASQAAMRYVAATEIHPRDHYKVDKARTLHLMCEAIRQKMIKFFQMDYRSRAEPGLLWDFLALVEDKMDSRSGRDTYRVIRSQSMTDDFAQATNIGACTLWYMHQAWPQIANDARFKIDEELLKQMGGQGVDWEEAVH